MLQGADEYNRTTTEIVYNIIGEYQGDFRSEQSTTDQMFAVKQELEKSWKYKIVMCQLFVDFSQAYDSVNRNYLHKVMIELKSPLKLIRLVKATMINSEGQVKIQNELTQSLSIVSELKRGVALPPPSLTSCSNASSGKWPQLIPEVCYG
ncbi:uncharacterized protein LOC119646439 [Hermetia illucens]|uniref:uncharacterized protein LOC119646439 n=1 Tax=Hermetia illucens TaxID=343691 RepID=UPI0018CC484C|nr:uncharacterized protein LOC119646439 [Hermetia illucens]